MRESVAFAELLLHFVIMYHRNTALITRVFTRLSRVFDVLLPAQMRMPGDQKRLGAALANILKATQYNGRFNDADYKSAYVLPYLQLNALMSRANLIFNLLASTQPLLSSLIRDSPAPPGVPTIVNVPQRHKKSFGSLYASGTGNWKGLVSMVAFSVARC